MNASAEEFRKITMKVLVMQLASTTIMDLVAYGGAGVGIALAIVGLMNGWLAPAAALFWCLWRWNFPAAPLPRFCLPCRHERRERGQKNYFSSQRS